MIEAGLVATGLTGSWVRTVQGLVFLIADHLLSLHRRAAAPGGPAADRGSRRFRPKGGANTPAEGTESTRICRHDREEA